MNKTIGKKLRKIDKSNKRKTVWRRVVATLAAITVFCTTYALVLPALTMINDDAVTCGLVAHTHDDSCYLENTSISFLCTPESHTHTDECYDALGLCICEYADITPHVHSKTCFDEDGNCVCGYADYFIHTHDDNCYDKNGELICTLPEVEEHEHDEDCYDLVTKLACDLSEAGHVHSDGCYATELILSCEKADEGHSHTDDCYAERLACICGLEESEEHTHTDDCYVTEKYLACDLEESVPHIHNDECYTELRTTICGLEESEGHTHTDDCYKTEEGLVCNFEEPVYHVHNEDCYDENDELICKKPEVKEATFHKHTKECFNEDGEMICGHVEILRHQHNEKCLDKETERILICELPEHEHDMGCFAKDRTASSINYACGNEYEHTHNEDCYLNGVLLCTLVEHTHTASCYDCTCGADEGEEHKLTCPKSILEESEQTVEDIIPATTIESEPASDGAVAVITGILPKNAAATIEAVEIGEDELVAYFGEAKAAAMNSYVAYDIKIMVGDEEWQPDSTVNVTVRHPEITVESSEKLAVAHVDSDTDKITEVSAEMDETGVVTFDTNGFSVYIFYTFTVDFHYGDVSFSIYGRTEITLSELFAELGIEKNAADVTSVTFSDPTLIEIEQTEGDWILRSLEPFDTNEELTVIFADNEVLTIKVTDAAIAASTGYWKKVKSIDDPTGTYIIAYNNGNNNYALTRNTSNSNYNSTNLTITAINGQTNYYTVSTQVPDAAQITFHKAVGQSGTTTITTEATPYYLAVASTGNFRTSENGNTTLNVEYSSSYNNKWRISNSSGYFLRYNNGYATSNSTNQSYMAYRNLDIYKYYGGTTVSSGTYTVNVYTIPVDKNGTATGEAVFAGTLTVNSNSTTTEMSSLFSSYKESGKVSGTYVSTYYGTEYSKTLSGVVSATRSGGSSSRRLSLATSSGSSTYSSASTNALFLQYTPDSGTGGGEEGDDEPLKEQPTYAPDTPNDVVSGSKKGSLDENTVKSIFSAGTTVKEGITGTYASDPSSSKIEDRFFSVPTGNKYPSINDGKLTTDKTVIYGADDYGAFSSYAPDTFSITLSALAQDYYIEQLAKVNIPVDVVFVLDVSGSMGNTVGGVTRRQAVVEAVNNTISEIMEQNDANRVGIAVYSSGGNIILPLNHYNKSTNGDYVYLSSNNITSRTMTYTDTNGTTRNFTGTNGESGGFTQQHGTYTQYGIALGAKILTDEDETTFTANVTIGEGSEAVTVQHEIPRQPVFILLSDGDPTFFTPSYNNVLGENGGTVTHYGSGVYTNDNNKGVHGYYTILSANYYKNKVSEHYNGATKFYTVGMGINATGTADASEQSYTGDHYKRAVLNPTEANVNYLTTNDGSPKNKADTAQMLYDLLHKNNTTGYSVTVGTTSSNTNFGTAVAGPYTINQPNPYLSTGYSYADSASFGNLTADDLEKIFSDIFTSNVRVKDHGFLLQKDKPELDIEDTIGTGMEIKGDPVLRYNGKNYTTFNKTTSGNVTTYKFIGTAKTTDGSGFTGGEREVDLQTITVTVTKASDGTQTVKMTIPETSLPSLTPQTTANHDKLWYYEELPVRLIYQVGLTSAAKNEVANLAAGKSKTYYTNAFDLDKTNNVYTPLAQSVAIPSITNPYNNPQGTATWGGNVIQYGDDEHIEGFYVSHEHEKTNNTTGTAAYSLISTEAERRTQEGQEAAGEVKALLGNNGMLTFTNANAAASSAPDHYKRIDWLADNENSDNPDTDLDNKDIDLGKMYRLYLDVGPESNYTDVDVLMILDVSSSMDENDNNPSSTDILGTYPVKRYLAMDSLLNGSETPGVDNRSTLYSNGLISKIFALNPDNRIAITAFDEYAETVENWENGWSSTPKVATPEFGSGTNYIAGLQSARALLDQVTGENDDGKKKIVLFFSDGDPNYYYQSLSDTTIRGQRNINRVTDEDRAYMHSAIDEFKGLYSDLIASGDLKIFSVGIGEDFTTSMLEYISTDGKAIRGSNFQDILTSIDSIITNGVGHYTHLDVTDTLSKYVNFYTPQVDFTVNRVYEETGESVPLYANGKKTELGGEILDTVSYDVDAKTIDVKFLEDYEEVAGFKYSISFNVIASDEAFAEYAENPDTDKYDGQVGDPDTDYAGNETSSEKPGFFSNEESNLHYEQKLGDKKVGEGDVPFDDPVIQVWDKPFSVTLKINKIDNYGTPITKTSAKFKIYYLENSEEVAVGDGTYITDENGSITIENVRTGKRYYIEELAAPVGYSLIDGALSFSVDQDGIISVNPGDTYLSVNRDGTELNVKNYFNGGDPLPSTGGMGSEKLIAIGISTLATIIFAAGAIIISKRRRSK